MRKALGSLSIFILMVCLAPTSFGQAGNGDSTGRLPSPNGPMRLGQSPDLSSAQPDEDDRSTDDESSGAPSDQEQVTESTDSTIPSTAAVANDPVKNETEAAQAPPRKVDPVPLGVPNGLLSARPVSAGDAVGEEQAGSWLGALDPRKNEFLRVLGALAIVIGLLLLIRMFIRKTPGLGGGFRPSGVVEVLARYPVGRGQQLIILKLARRVILLHHAGNHMRELTTIDDPAEVAALLARMESGASGRGKSVFKGVLGRYLDEHKRVMQSKRGKSQYWADDVETGDVVDLTRRSNGTGHAAATPPLPASNQVVTRPRTTRRSLLRR